MKKIITIIISLLFVLLVIDNIKLEAQNKHIIMRTPVFKSETEVMAWGTQEMGYVDSLHYNIEGQEILVIIGDYHSGIKANIYYVFSKNKYGFWNFLCTRDTHSNGIIVEVDMENKQLKFKDSSNKILMILPFDSLGI